MPKAKHGRTPGGKTVHHPGRNKPGGPPKGWSAAPDENAAPDVSGLPLFNWVEKRPPAVPRDQSQEE
jgi:hypothetical protein